MQIVSLVGFKGSGKDSAGKHLIDNHGFVGFSFADSLKDAVASVFCWDRAMMEGDTPESRVWREQVDPWWAEKLGIPNFSPRMAMQLLGTNVFRDNFNQNIWILNVERRILNLIGDRKVVLIDGRFPNELDLGRRYNSTVIRVKRGPEPEWFNEALWINTTPFDQDRFDKLNDIVHVSEWAWIGQSIDHTIENDKTLKDLHIEIERLVFK